MHCKSNLLFFLNFSNRPFVCLLLGARPSVEAEADSSRRKVFVDYQEPSTDGFSRDSPLPSMIRDESDGSILSM